MTPESKILLNVGLKLFTPVLKVFTKRLEKTYAIYRILRRHNIIKTKSDFDSIYLETLYQLIEVKKKDRRIIALFEVPEVILAFKEELYKKNNWTFKLNLDSNLHTNPKLRSLKTIYINLNDEIDVFKSVFKATINNSRKPKELEEFETLQKIKKAVNSYVDKDILIDKFGRTVEIDNQILLSKSDILILSDKISQRKKLVNELLKRLDSFSWIAIYGSIATGKSQLTVLLMQNISYPTFWITLSDFNSSNFIVKIFSDLSSFLSCEYFIDFNRWQDDILKKIEKNSCIILDDLPKLDFRNQAFQKFVRFIEIFESKGIKFITTSNFECLPEFKKVTSKRYIYEIKMPELILEDVYEIIIEYGCSEKKAKIYKSLIHSISSGHPIIVKAICEFLANNGWEFSEEDLLRIFRDDYSLEINKDTYEILSKTITDDVTRNLLYRLNILIGTFSLEDVRIIANCTPSIPNAIERFNTAIGIWIQKIDNKHFEVSPLLKKLQSKDLSPTLERKINHTIGKSILDKRKLNQFEAGIAITYFIKAQSFNEAAFVLIIVLKEALDNPKLYFDWGINLYWYSTPLPEKMDLVLKIQIRVMQIMLNKLEKNDVAFLISDLENLCVEASKNGFNVGPAYVLLAYYYLTSNSKKALNYLLSGSKHYKTLVDDLSEDKLWGFDENFEAMIWGTVINIKSKEEIAYWFESISQLPLKQQKALRESEHVDFGSIIIFKNLIEIEEKKPAGNQDWNELVNLFEEVKLKATEINFVLLIANAVKYTIYILSDKLIDIDKAYDYAKSNSDFFSDNVKAEFLVKDEIGRQLFYFDRIDESTPFVASAVDIEVNEFYTEKLDTFLVMSQIIGKRDNQVALFYSKKAKEFIIENKFTSDLLRSKVIGEYAISCFLNGNMIDAIYSIEEGFEILINSYNIKTEYHIIILRYGHVLNYWYQILTKGRPPEKDMLGGPYTPPSRGMFVAKYEDNLVEEIYFSERRFFVTQLIFNCFEALGDFKLARKWAYYNISTHKDIEFNSFSLILSHSIPYLIIDNKFIEAAELQVSVIDSTNKLLHLDSKDESITDNKYLKELLAKRPKSEIKEYDETLVEFIIVPVILRYLTNNVGQIKRMVDHLETLEEFILEIENKFTDKLFIERILELISHIKEYDDNIAKELTEDFENYNGKYKTSLQLIAYLFLSMFSSSIDAFKLHFALIARLHNLFSRFSVGSYNFILTPYFEKFWFNRIDKQQNDFTDLVFWVTKSKPYYLESKPQNKIKTLFKVLAHHLNYQTTIEEEEWLDI